jgi:uncharacterized NAD-dependent epimerase/dehydratase family protein
MMGTAIILTNGKLAVGDAKTAHGLIRGTSRFDIVGVIDSVSAGKDAGEVLDGRTRGIPVYPSITACIKDRGQAPDYCIVGVALSGGMLPQDWHPMLLEAIAHKISLVSGLHQPLGDIPALKDAAREYGVEIIDIRKPKPIEQLHFWKGEIFQVKAPKIAVLGMDCALGKRTTCRFIQEMCEQEGIRAEMIYTGQTGWMQGYKHGFIFDATLNDFVCGELENAIVTCDREVSPDLILIEGQSGLRNPSGPCGSEIIVSGDVKGVILQHAPFRGYYEEMEEFGCLLPDVKDEIDLIRMYGADTLAVTLNGENSDEASLKVYQEELRDRINRPVVRPLKEGVRALLPVIQSFMQKQ